MDLLNETFRRINQTNRLDKIDWVESIEWIQAKDTTSIHERSYHGERSGMRQIEEGLIGSEIPTNEEQPRGTSWPMNHLDGSIVRDWLDGSIVHLWRAGSRLWGAHIVWWNDRIELSGSNRFTRIDGVIEINWIRLIRASMMSNHRDWNQLDWID